MLPGVRQAAALPLRRDQRSYTGPSSRAQAQLQSLQHASDISMQLCTRTGTNMGAGTNISGCWLHSP